VNRAKLIAVFSFNALKENDILCLGSERSQAVTCRIMHMAEHRGYGSGHCWYYRLGGRILRISEIRAEVAENGNRHVQDDIKKADSRPEPARSEELMRIRERLQQSVRKDAIIYRHRARALRARRVFIGPIDPHSLQEMLNEPYTAVSLKHNHVYYGLSQIAAIDALKTEVQMSLF